MSAVPSGLGIDIWRSCRFICALFRSLCALPGGIGRFLPRSIGANHCRLRHVGWKRCGHGLTSRPRETVSRYPPGSAPALLAGNQPLWYCVAKFAGGIPTWRLPAYGQVAELVSEGEEVGVAQVEPGEVGVAWISGAGRVGKRVRLNRHTLVFQGSVGVQSRSRIWKRLCIRVVASNDRIYFCS